MQVLNGWPNRGIRLLTCGQILREYLVAATRPASSNGMGLSVASALGNVEELKKRLRFLEENVACAESLARLVLDLGGAGKKIHDANLVATLLAHRESALVTANTRDFRRFESLVRVVDLSSVKDS